VATGSPAGREARIVPTKPAGGKLRRTLVLAALFAGLLARAAPAQQAAVRFPVRAWPDGAILGAGLAAALVPQLWPASFAHATCAPCNPSRLWALDRGAVGPVRSVADVASTGVLGVEAVLGAAFLAASRRGQGFAPLAEDAVVIAQAMTVTSAATEWAKVLFHRPRPFLYVPTASSVSSADYGRSFPSGHTSVAFAAAAAYASVLHRRGIAGRHGVEIGVLFATAATTGVLRVVAHKHFPTDVAAGAILGFAIGWTVPALHTTTR
jgi:membrane-associated phospholipid phosphatase